MSPLRVPLTEKDTRFAQPGKRVLARLVSRIARLALSGGTACLLGTAGITGITNTAHAGLAYWGSEGFVENADSKNRIWTPDFSMALGVFQTGFIPAAANRTQWLENWIPLSTATFSAAESRFAGVVDLSVPLPANAASQVYFWARNGDDLTKGPEWLLVTRADWKWPASSPADAPPLTWTTDPVSSTVLGGVGLNGHHLTSSRVVPVPKPRETWLAAYFPDAPEKRAPDADPDGDGLSNQIEYFLGSNPADSRSRVSPEILATGGNTLLTLKRNPYAATNFAVQSSVDLRQWSAASGETLQDAPDLIQVRIPGNADVAGKAVNNGKAPSSAFFRFKLDSAQP